MITLSKIAKLAHVSVSTVSKAFSGSSEVNEKTRELIFEIAKQENCFKKYYNVKYPKYVIAVICPEFRSRYYTTYLSSLHEELSKYNCEISVAATEFSKEKEEDLLEYYTKHSTVDGIIIVNPKTKLNIEVDIPIAAIGYSNNKNEIISINVDFNESISEAIAYFKENGVKDIGFIGEKLTTAKFNCFKNAMTTHGIKINEDFIAISDERFEEGGYLAMEELFKRNAVPRAIICSYDNLAFGAMVSIFEHGLKVPDDIAVLGMDDVREAKYMNPPLSSINLRIDTACEIAAKEIINKITDKPVNYENFIPYKLNLRKSTEIK
ncbi:MAG: LacI family DNA-binding transcriptional regulator [Clostridia bacterium]|nr:LacI family DNA-binding transcriptional regulator [Clostridia bacterium]